ncbi:hypothetical protein KTR10_00665 [Candidatus Kaiserbacteria bacterium]|nr:hypothetical protein [Candidatus Kaiserbacteria bacterium]
MSWWNLGGLNPRFKDFVEKYPKKTMIGMSWSLYWRLALLIVVVEVIILGGLLLFGEVLAMIQV